MTYKETFYFIAICLTISFEKKNKQLIEDQLKSSTIDWDAVVKLSTRHFVFPALYCNLQRAKFLHYLPQDLVAYMQHIVGLNREKNQQIIAQAKELNSFLLDNSITPIFIKGTGNLLASLYDDVAERMVGDIDFLFSKEEYPKAIEILKNIGYERVVKTNYKDPKYRHYPRLIKENSIAAIEIHKELLIQKYTNEFNYNFVKKDTQVIKKARVLSYANKLILSISANQINNKRFYYKTIALRNAYDVFLLSKKTNSKDAVNKLDKLNNPLNCFLAACHEVFKADSFEYNKTVKATSYLTVFKSQLVNIKKTKRHHKKIRIYLFIKLRLSTFFKAIIYKDYRVWLFKVLTDKNYYKEKLIQMKLKF